MLPASIRQNGSIDMGSRSPSSSINDEESFVVIDDHVDEVTGQILSLQCTDSIDSAECAIASFPTMQTMTNSEILTTPMTTTTPPITMTTTTTTPPITMTTTTTTPPPTTITTSPPPPETEIVGNVSSTTMITSQESNLSGASELSAEEIQQKMESLLRENAELKANLIQNNQAIKKQYEDLAKWHAEVVDVQKSHIIKFEETKKLVRNLKAENAELKKNANSCNNSSKEVVNLKSKISALEFELDTLRQANAKSSIDQVKIIDELGLKLSESEKSKAEESTKYQNQIDNLSSQLSHVEVEYEKIKEELADVKKKLPTEADAANIANMKEQLKELAEEVVLKNKMLKEKTELTDQLHEAISKLKIENEYIEILKTQVEVYQTDFNQERQEREKLKSEKDKIAEDLNHLHRRNQKLLEQIEMMQRNTGHGTETPISASSTRSTPTRTTREEQSIYECPKCRFAFYDYQALENHVYRCLESND